MKNQAGTLYLIPVLLGNTLLNEVLPDKTLSIAQTLNYFIAENAKSARQFLKLLNPTRSLQEIMVMEIDKHSDKPDYDFYFEALRSGHDTGIVSEAGMPAIADPGSKFVLQAHKENIRVVPLTGPSSIFLALAASGLNGQGFMFHGYLPKEKNERIARIRTLEKNAVRNNITQIFIETPYRNNSLLEDLLNNTEPNTLLCIAADISAASEKIITQSIREWKKAVPDLNKIPAVFLLL